MQFFIPNCKVRNIFSTNFYIESLYQNFHVVLRQFTEYLCYFLTETVIRIITYIPSCSMHIQNNNLISETLCLTLIPYAPYH